MIAFNYYNIIYFIKLLITHFFKYHKMVKNRLIILEVDNILK